MTDALPKLVCGGCRKCCIGDTIVLARHEDVTQYQTRLVDGQRVLRKGKDGNCVYLGRKGCTIYDRQPQMCRTFDCRQYARIVQAMPQDMRASRIDRPSVQEGLARLAGLS